MHFKKSTDVLIDYAGSVIMPVLVAALAVVLAAMSFAVMMLVLFAGFTAVFYFSAQPFV